MPKNYYNNNKETENCQKHCVMNYKKKRVHMGVVMKQSYTSEPMLEESSRELWLLEPKGDGVML